jgi:N-acetylglucosaminyl-diphospho-decaprenol L-rhamnosyltransferase
MLRNFGVKVTPKGPAISIVIVSHNSGHILGECLERLPEAAEIIVVDNASGDDSVRVAEGYPVRLIGLPENVGYGRACNRGAEAASGEFILFINPDVRLEPGSIARLAEAVERYPGAAAFAPRLLKPDGSIVFQDSSILCSPPHNKSKPKHQPAGDCCVEAMSGAAMFCRREAFIGLGGFDERIFLYYEDDDLCRRLRKAGWSLVYVYGALGRHEHGKSTRSRKGAIYFRSFHWAVSKAYVTRKHNIAFHPAVELFKSIIRGSLAALRCNSQRRERHFGLAAGYWAVMTGGNRDRVPGIGAANRVQERRLVRQ